ncbi:MAG: hypothetical protein SGBAC_003586 [Bacillariaceae sp.]
MNPLRFAALTSIFLLQGASCFVADSRNFNRGETILHAKSDADFRTQPNENPGRRNFFAVATMSFGAALLPALSAFAEDDDALTTLHINNYPIDGKCGEAKVPEAGVFFAKTFGKLEDGSCAAEGYTVDEGTANGTGEKDAKRTYSIYGK